VPIEADMPHYDRVHDIIERIAVLPRTISRAESRRGTEEQQELFDALVALGPEAAPAIVTLMDDARPLAHPAISLVNTAPDRFEGLRHYTPKVLTDALAAVLNQITGEHFGFIYNGATPAERRQTVDAWRAWLDQRQSGSAN
jgi:hypothetical protein